MDGDLPRVVERHGGAVAGAVIRPWSRAEVERRLRAAGFAGVALSSSPDGPTGCSRSRRRAESAKLQRASRRISLVVVRAPRLRSRVT